MNFLLNMIIGLHKMMATPFFWFVIIAFSGLGRYILLDITTKYAGKPNEFLSSEEIKRKRRRTLLARGLFTISLTFTAYFVIIIVFL